ncbi:WW domain-containing oxidoreductase-like protein [Hapsidospora chrysogenum ATCC 11550]|uniref:WW domain-containing oxidoreductase-like protein n=1 Tax=Hapsidospora chrysogenum (strain ATCC 11550 / CBS 779.69 / DSM 880 / IAM 14645 / JCM 23072 / IMI 49137) TaxID=857340 RepID=A0A086T9G5_HAPC1|nr:WW domain-containing oxidoreductase-like protein [Hapsidospora chrysogenum ATCC 11550]
MATAAKTIIATGVSSGLGFEAVRQLLEQPQPYRVILGARSPQRTQEAYDALTYDRTANPITVLPLELNDLRNVQSFAKEALEKLGQDKVDYVLLNGATSKGAEEPGPHGSKWCEALIVNHLSHHYLMHLLREKLVASKSRIVFVSSGAVRNVPDVTVLEEHLRGGSGVSYKTIYPETKFVGLLGAHWWRRQLQGQCEVVAVSPGLIPATNIMRAHDREALLKHADAKSPAEGGANVLRALFRDDIPEDPERIFLTSWGEWWEKDVYGNTLDKELQDKWCPSKEQLEKEEGLSS